MSCVVVEGPLREIGWAFLLPAHRAGSPGQWANEEPHTRRHGALSPKCYSALTRAYGVRTAPCAIHRSAAIPPTIRIRNTASLQTDGNGVVVMPWKSASPCGLSGTGGVSNGTGVPRESHTTVPLTIAAAGLGVPMAATVGISAANTNPFTSNMT